MFFKLSILTDDARIMHVMLDRLAHFTEMSRNRRRVADGPKVQEAYSSTTVTHGDFGNYMYIGCV